MSGNTRSVTGPQHRLSERNNARESQHHRLVSRMLLEGYSPKDIAASLAISTATVNRVTTELQRRWIADADNDYKLKLAQELANLKELEREAKRAWRRSQKPAQTKRQTFARRKAKGVSPDADPLDLMFAEAEPDELVLCEEVTETKGRDGDPRYLELVHKCTETRLKIMGAFKDISIFANCITGDQMMQFANAFIESARLELGDGEALSRIKERTVKLLPNVTIHEPDSSPATMEPVEESEPEQDAQAFPEV